MAAKNGIRKWRTSGSENCSLGAKAAFFGPKMPRNTFKTAKRRETVGTLHVRLDFPVSTSSLQPSNSMRCPRNGPKRPAEAPNADSHKPRIGHILGYGSKCDSEGTYSTRNPPLFVVSTPQNCPNGRLDPKT